jgi:PIN domain nuclease of toxin-antitoxin system
LIVLDTHVWLWWASDPRRLTRKVRAAIDASDAIGICTVSAWEVAMLVLRERIQLDRDVSIWIRQALAQPAVQALDLTAEIALAAALIEREGLRGDPVDRMIYATARAYGARLATRDKALRGFDPARTIW